MRTVPAEIWQRLMPLIEAGALLRLVIIELDRGDAFHLVNNTRGVPFNGKNYRPWPVQVGELSDGGDGDQVGTTITVANIHRITMPYLEAGTWDQGNVFVQHAYRAEGERNYVDTGITFGFRIQSATANDKLVTFSVGAPEFLNIPFPWETYIREEKYPAIPRTQ